MAGSMMKLTLNYMNNGEDVAHCLEPVMMEAVGQKQSFSISEN
jgi:hypothetical protein